MTVREMAEKYCGEGILMKVIQDDATIAVFEPEYIDSIINAIADAEVETYDVEGKTFSSSIVILTIISATSEEETEEETE